jgi:hypothetical protein
MYAGAPDGARGRRGRTRASEPASERPRDPVQRQFTATTPDESWVAGIAPSVGSTGNRCDDELADPVIGLYKAEVIHGRGPWRGFDDVGYATLEWVAWFHRRRLLEPLGYLPSAEFREQLYRTRAAQADRPALEYPRLRRTRAGSGAGSGGRDGPAGMDATPEGGPR